MLPALILNAKEFSLAEKAQEYENTRYLENTRVIPPTATIEILSDFTKPEGSSWEKQGNDLKIQSKNNAITHEAYLSYTLPKTGKLFWMADIAYDIESYPGLKNQLLIFTTFEDAQGNILTPWQKTEVNDIGKTKRIINIPKSIKPAAKKLIVYVIADEIYGYAHLKNPVLIHKK